MNIDGMSSGMVETMAAGLTSGAPGPSINSVLKALSNNSNPFSPNKGSKSTSSSVRSPIGPSSSIEQSCPSNHQVISAKTRLDLVREPLFDGDSGSSEPGIGCEYSLSIEEEIGELLELTRLVLAGGRPELERAADEKMALDWMEDK